MNLSEKSLLELEDILFLVMVAVMTRDPEGLHRIIAAADRAEEYLAQLEEILPAGLH